MQTSKPSIVSWLFIPTHTAETFLEQERNKQLLLFLFLLAIVTTFNFFGRMISMGFDAFTTLSCLSSIAMYVIGRFRSIRLAAIGSALIALLMPYVLYIVAPHLLSLITIFFLSALTLMLTSQFLSLRVNLQLSIIVIVTIFVLQGVAINNRPVTLTSLLVPVIVTIMLSLFNAYGYERIKTYLTHQRSPTHPIFFEYALDLMPDAAFVVVKSEIVAVNQMAATLFGQSRARLIGENIDMLIPAYDGSSVVDPLADALTVRYQATLEGGSKRVEVVRRNVQYNNQIASLFVVRPLADEVSQASSIAVLDDNHPPMNEYMFQQLANSIADYAYGMSIDGDMWHLEWVSGLHEDMLGLSAEGLSSLEDWDSIILEDDLPFYKLRKKALREGAVRSLQYRVVHQDGSMKWVQDSAYPIQSTTSGEVTQVMAIVNDVTDNVEAQEMLKTHVMQQAAVADLGLLALNTRDVEQLMQHVTILCEQVLSAGFVAIFDYEAPANQLRCAYLSRLNGVIAVGHTVSDVAALSLPAFTLHASEPVISDNLADEARFKLMNDFLQRQYRSAVGIAIQANSEVAHGVLVAYSEVPHDFSPDEIYFLQAITNVLTTFLERERALQLERQQTEFTEALRDATAAINANLDLRDVLSKIMNYAQQVAPATEQASIMLRNDDTQRFFHYLTLGFPIDSPEAQSLFAYRAEDFPLLALMIATAAPIYIADTVNDKRWIMRENVTKTRSYLGAPIVADDDVIGFIHLHAYTPDAFNETDLQRLQTFAETAGNAILNARKKEDLERDVAARTAELQQQSNRIQTIIEATADGIFYAENQSIAFVNDALCQMTGYRRADLLNKLSTLFRPDDITEDELEKLSQIASVTESGATWRDQLRIRRRDGTTFEAGLTVSRIDSDDDVRRTVTIMRDMSREKQLEELKRNLIAGAAHDLRSPINSLILRTHMIRKDPDKLVYHMDRVDYVIERMNNLVSDLLESYGQIKLRTEPLILQTILDQVVDILALESEVKGITFTYSKLETPISLLADRHRLEKVFFNLITNAINYTDEGEITVCYHLTQDGTQVQIDIQDTGVGIPPEDLKNIFLPFFRAKGNERKGNGLGLSITQEIVEQHQGKVSVKSTLGEGSTFSVLLPIYTIT